MPASHHLTKLDLYYFHDNKPLHCKSFQSCSLLVVYPQNMCWVYNLWHFIDPCVALRSEHRFKLVDGGKTCRKSISDVTNRTLLGCMNVWSLVHCSNLGYRVKKKQSEWYKNLWPPYWVDILLWFTSSLFLEQRQHWCGRSSASSHEGEEHTDSQITCSVKDFSVYSNITSC